MSEPAGLLVVTAPLSSAEEGRDMAAPPSDEELVGIDTHAVGAWLQENVAAVSAPLRFRLIAGGHSCLTYEVATADGRRFALRRPPLGKTLATAHDVLREHRVITALAPTEVPVAPVVGVCRDPDVTGAPFYVMDFVDGPILHDSTDAGALDTDARRRAGESMIDALVTLQAVDPDAVGLGDFAKRTDYLGRQIRRWSSQWTESLCHPMEGMDRLHRWLEDNRPTDPDTVHIVHGDFRLGNVVHRGDGTVAALLDWELCTLGPPLADLSYFLRSWVDATTTSPSPAPASAAPGFPSRRELLERYERRSGHDTADLDYWMAFHAWRSTCIAAGVYTRYKTGAMGAVGEDVEQFRRSVEQGVHASLQAAGLEP